MAGPFDLVQQLLFTEIGGLPSWAFIVGFFFLYQWVSQFIKMKQKEMDKFKRLDLYKKVKDNFKNALAYFSFDAVGDEFQFLRKGYTVIGIVSRITMISWPFKIKDIIKKEKDKTEDEVEDDFIKEIKKQVTRKKPDKSKAKTESKEFFLFETYPNSIIGKLMMKFKREGKYTIVDEDYIRHDGKNYIINPNAQFVEYLGIYIFSDKSKQIVSDVAFKIVKEQELDELVNFLPKMTYLELNQAKFSSKLDKISQMDRKKREEAIDRLVKGEG